MNHNDHDRWRRRYFQAMNERHIATWTIRWMLALLSVLLLAGNRLEFHCGWNGVSLVVEPVTHHDHDDAKEQP